MALDRKSVDTSTARGTITAFIREVQTARRSKERSNFFGYLFIAPALALFLVFQIWPIIRGLSMAFTDYRFVYPDTMWDWNGLANYQEMIKDKVFWDSVWISTRYTLIVVPSVLIISLLLAVLISKVRHWTGFYRWSVYLPTILPIAVTLLMFSEFYNNKFGFINANLRALGMSRPPNWLGQVKTALGAVAVTDIWRGFGFPTLLFLIGIYGISQEVYEAASIDGANPWHQFSQITIPLLKPTFMLVLVLYSGIAGATEQMMILTNGGPQNSTRTVGLYYYQVAFQFGDLRLGYASAMALFLGLISAAMAAFWFRVLRER